MSELSGSARTGMSGWARLWLVLSIAVALALLAFGLQTADKPFKVATFHIERVSEQLLKPACAKFYRVTPATTEYPFIPDDFKECGDLIGMRLDWPLGGGDVPNTPEDFRLRYAQVLAEYEYDSEVYRTRVFYWPAGSLVIMWAAFFPLRRLIRWVREGFRLGTP